MDYYKILNLNREPFSNSPDPDFFFKSHQHEGCLQQLEISFRLRRGLNVVIGDVGTGKTTLCRQLIRRFSNTEEMITHLILDPSFSNPLEFLLSVAGMFNIDKPMDDTDEVKVKEQIKQYLYQKGVDEDKTVILIIDEGQKIPVFCLEILREFLNYETNVFKLLQIVIFAQPEFEEQVIDHINFTDRINLYHVLKPMSFNDTRKMISFRLKRSSNGEAVSFFSFPALWAIYLTTGGYPRKIVNLCHRSLLTMIIQNQTRAGWFLIRSCAGRLFPQKTQLRLKRFSTAVVVLSSIIIAGYLVFSWLHLDIPRDAVSARGKAVKGDISHSAALEKKKASLSKTISPVPSPAEQIEAAPVIEAALLQKASIAKEIKTEKNPEPAREKESEKISSVIHKYPEIIGSIAVKRGETFGDMLKCVYGTFTPVYLQRVAQLNPHINDPNNVEIGDIINFPAIPKHVQFMTANAWWIRIAKKKDLEDAFNCLRDIADKAPPAYIIPFWNQKEGLTFFVVLKGFFAEKETAALMMNLLPVSIASSGEIMSSWDKDAVFFADPYKYSANNFTGLKN